MKEIILETKNLLKKFDGVHAVDHLSILIRSGIITAIIGPNGSGKTTLLNLLSGMLPMDGGAVMLEGITLRRIRPAEISSYGITRTFQEVRLFNQMSVEDNLIVALTERNVWGALFEKHTAFHLKTTETLLRKVGLWEKRRDLAINLSYGQRKLLEMARALAMDAKIFLLDEPFAGLFPEMTKVMAAVLKELRDSGKTIVLIEHNMNVIRELSDWIVVLDSGRLLAEGTIKDVLSRKDVIEAYLGE